MIMVDSKLNELHKKKRKCLDLYEAFVKYYKEGKISDLDEFVKAVSVDVNEKLTLPILNSYIINMKKEISPSKANIMENIISYLKGNKSVKPYIDDQIIKQSIKFGGVKTDYCDNLHKEKMEKLVGEMKKVIKDERSYKQLVDDNEIENERLFSDANKYIGEIDDDVYLDFVIKYRGLEKLSLKELSEYKKLLEYFTNYLQRKNVLLMSMYNEVDIRNLKVAGDEELSEYYTDNVTRLKQWKFKKIECLIEYYKNIHDVISQLIETKNVESIKKVKFDKKVMASEEDFIIDYHNNLQSISDLFKNIKKLNNITDNRNKTLCKKYSDKLIIENN